MHSFTLALTYANRISCIRLNKFGSTSFSFRDLLCLFVAGFDQSLQRPSIVYKGEVTNEFPHIAT